MELEAGVGRCGSELGVCGLGCAVRVWGVAFWAWGVLGVVVGLHREFREALLQHRLEVLVAVCSQFAISASDGWAAPQDNSDIAVTEHSQLNGLLDQPQLPLVEGVLKKGEREREREGFLVSVPLLLF